MNVNIQFIKPNPYRNFDKFPIDQEHVEVLKSTISRSGMWKNLEGRRAPGQNGYVEIAYGHHRIEAAKQLDLKSVDISIAKLNEDQMIDRMVTENTTQRGYTTIAVYDSVRAIMKRLAYILLSNEWGDLVSTRVDTKLFEDKKVKSGKKVFGQAKAALQSGEGVGERIIHRYNDSLALREIRAAIAAMKDAGEVKAILQEVGARISAEAEQKRLEAEKLKKEAKKKADADALKLEEMAAETEQIAAQQPAAKVDGEALQMFPKAYQADAFRKLVTTNYHNGMQVIPIEKHVELANLLIATHARYNPAHPNADEISKGWIDDFIRPILSTGRLNQYEIEKTEAVEARKADIYSRADHHITEILNHTKEVQWHIQEFGNILKSHSKIVYQLPSTRIANIPFELKKAIDKIKKLAAQFENLT